ncbi:MAG TPA: hypothetical protein VGF91_00695, partial [Solirubrobacteraceae bacterium]
MLKTDGVGCASPRELTLKQLAGTLERVHSIARNTGCNTGLVRPIGQDFTIRRVISQRKGVKIGGHRGHLRGRRWTTSNADLRHPSYVSWPTPSASIAPEPPRSAHEPA